MKIPNVRGRRGEDYASFQRLLFSSNHALNFLLVLEPLLQSVVSEKSSFAAFSIQFRISYQLRIRVINYYLEVEIEKFYFLFSYRIRQRCHSFFFEERIFHLQPGQSSV